MALEEFANCYATKIETTLDAIWADLQAIGADGVRAVVDWWNSLNQSSQDLVKVVAPIATAVLVKILEKALNLTVAAGLAALLGGASWTLLILTFAECSALL